MSTTTISAQEDARMLAAQQARRRKLFWDALGRTSLHTTLILLSIAALVPVLWMISSSLKASTEVFAANSSWIPLNPRWQNYADAFEMAPLWLNMGNTLIVCVGTVVGTVVSSALVAYSFARLHWPGKNFFFALLIATMVLPGIVTMVPRYVMFARFFPAITGFPWVNTFLPLIVPTWFATQGLYIFLLRQFFVGIPEELEDAARIDGASTLRILWQVVLPLSKPALISVVVFTFLYHYADFLEPLIYLSNTKTWTLAVAIRSFNDQFYATSWELVFATGTFALMPMIVLFFVAQRYFVEGIHLTGFGGR
jgi:ABC-type glycerol-3-phosphate transport system permease component